MLVLHWQRTEYKVVVVKSLLECWSLVTLLDGRRRRPPSIMSRKATCTLHAYHNCWCFFFLQQNVLVRVTSWEAGSLVAINNQSAPPPRSWQIMTFSNSFFLAFCTHTDEQCVKLAWLRWSNGKQAIPWIYLSNKLAPSVFDYAQSHIYLCLLLIGWPQPTTSEAQPQR